MPLLKPPRAIQLNRSHPLARGLVGCWLMNEGGGNKIYDLSGHNNVGTFAGDTKWAAGKFGSCLSFDGTGDYVQIPYSPVFQFNNAFTVSVWFYFDGAWEEGAIVQHMTNVSGNYNGWMIWTINSDVRLYINAAIRSQYTLPAAGWYHGAFVWDGAYTRIYIDGTQKDSDAWSTAPVCDPTHSITMARYYKYGNEGDLAYDEALEIDHVMIFNRALTAAEIRQLYREPFCMFQPRVSPGLLFAPAGQIISLAGTCAASSNITGSLKLTRRIAGAIAAQSQTYGFLTVVGQTPPGEQLFSGSLNIEQNWLLAALFSGMTANAFKLGTALTLGWFWMRRSGCCALYRGPTIDQIDFTNALTVAKKDARQISPPSYAAHGNNCTYFYAVRRFNTSGYQEHTLAALAKVAIDADGNLMPLQPNNIFAAAAQQVDGNKIKLTWFYCPLRQGSVPVCFRIYHDAATGQIDYQNPLGTISYQGQKFYTYLTEPLAGGRYLFAMRPEDAEGIQNNSAARLIVQLTPETPEAIDILSAESA